MIYSTPRKIKVSKKFIDRCIEEFDKTGQTGLHSPHGVILHHILNHCIEKGISFELTYAAGIGYSARRIEL